MKTIKYKTMKGLLNQTKQMTVENFLNSCFYHNTKGWINFELPDEIKYNVIECFARYCSPTKKRQQRIIERCKYYNDPSFFQCFYICHKKGNIYFSNSLSGDIFNYCIREFLK